MSSGLLLFVGLIYLVVAVGYWRAGRYGLCAAFIFYAAANLGFAWDARS